ncbi:SDR family NAD(P)-dependent oxidoreductase [Niameybacter massiliensis]|uniref:SDR family NAD(P)-dependent oxidoreductase n=1 Tax=Niameybacter massiliensis TaxID=1658108 RepID=UPI0006B57E3D|nr:SDR family oxidoreductase [Niameybacter massiliensis]
MKLKDKVAIVTGGTKGIGYGIAQEYLKEGAKVVITGREKETGHRAEQELSKLGAVKYIYEDVSDLQLLQNTIDQTVSTFGRLDIYMANAGINDANKTHFIDITSEQYDRIMDVNLKGMFFGGQFAARQMIKQGEGGAIVNMASVNSYLGLDSQVVYTVSKGGIVQLTKVQAIALNDYGIKVNALAPGPIETELMRRVGNDTQLMDTILSRTPIGRIGTPNECGKLAVFLSCEESDFIFGQTIYIDGGRSFQAFPTKGYKTVTDQDYELLQQIKA